MTDSTAPFGADLAGVIVGLEEYTVLDAVDDGALTVEVTPVRGEAPCPGCGVFSARVKSRRRSTLTDCAAFGRPARLAVIKRAFRCDTEWCSRLSFTPCTAQVPARARLTARCRARIGRAGRDRSTASVAGEYGVSWWTAWRCVARAAREALAARDQHDSARVAGPW